MGVWMCLYVPGFLSGNRLKTIPYRAFYNVHTASSVDKQQIIMLSDNPIETIQPEAFKLGGPHLLVFLLRTKLKILSLESVVGLGMDSKMVMKNRTFQTLENQKFKIYLNPLISDSEAISVDYPTFHPGSAYASALLASGFREKDAYEDFNTTFIPCPLGTFIDPSTKGKRGCQNCPPGGFYSDIVGYVGETCRRCPNGSFVAYDKTPGTQHRDCKSCPLGTETDFFAGKRACKCLEGHYRTHMFEQCFKCGQGGLKCQDDYASLKSGHWWEWRNKSHNDRYKLFIQNLLSSSPALDAFHVQYPYPIPTPYMCQAEESCKGGLDSSCDNGYEGPLCSVCSLGYYKQFRLCTSCPSKTWIVTQLSIIFSVVLITIAVLVWTSKKKNKKDDEQHLIDKFFSKVKILIGFYQVTYGLLDVFSYIEWPGSLETIAKYSGFLQLNVLQIAPIQCLFSGLHLDAFGSLFAIMAMNFAIICLSAIAYGVHKLLISRNHNLEEEEKSRRVLQSKELVYRNLFFFLYVTHLSTCYKTASVLPPACRKLCRDDKEVLCSKFLRADYSVPCQGQKYNHMLIVAYISTVYIFALPAASFIALWRQRRARLATEDGGTPKDLRSNKEMISGLRFLFENYKTRSWYWELVEMTRKVILTCGLIFVEQESRSYIGLALVIAGMYGFLFAWMKPLQDVTENRLMTTSLAVTVVNLVIGATSKIPAENVTGTIGPDTDAHLFIILIFAANSFVIGQLLVEYALFLYDFLKEWRNNPHWSFSCCLALLLPLSDLQGEIAGMAGTNVLKTQVQTGEFEMVTLSGVIKDIGAIDVTLEENEGSDDDGGETVEAKDDNRQAVKYSSTKRDQGIQTELLSLFTTPNDTVHESIEEAHL
ncbi:uncharacterized protein LOC144666621 [Oculina patagonica]